MSSNAVFALPLLAIAFFIGFVSSLFDGGHFHWGDALVQWSVIAVSLTAFMFVRREDLKRRTFMIYLKQNAQAVRDGTAIYEGQPLTYATRVRVYTIVLSLLLVSVRLPARISIGRDLGMRIGCSAFTFVFGWWGIPWGPLWTIKALVDNARGKPEVSIGELIEGKSTIDLASAAAR